MVHCAPAPGHPAGSAVTCARVRPFVAEAVHRVFRVRRTSVSTLLGLALVVGLFSALPASAADPADPSDVALVFDMSASILDDKGTREQFAAALDRIAGRVV